MKSLYFDGRKLSERKTRKPAASGDEALIEVTLAGICSTDLEILKGYMGFRGIPGHEFVGRVVSAPSGRLIGKRVTGEINIPCGKCSLCRGGLGKHCGKRKVLGISGKNGAFAEYITLPAANLHTVPEGVSDEAAAFTELLAAACEIPERALIERKSRAAVLGDGRLAAMAAQVMRQRTADLRVFGLHKRKMETIASLGIETVDFSEEARFSGYFDVVAECTGSPAGIDAASRMTRPRGTVVLKSTFHGRGAWNPTQAVVDEITVTGSRCGPFEKAIELLENGSVETEPFLTAVYPFERWEAAFRRAAGRDSFKVLIRF